MAFLLAFRSCTIVLPLALTAGAGGPEISLACLDDADLDFPHV